jgi:hypothetical protein
VLGLGATYGTNSVPQFNSYLVYKMLGKN